MFYIYQTSISDDQYIFTRLNRVLDFMPSSNTLTHQLFPKPPTVHDGRLHSVNGNSTGDYDCGRTITP